MDRPTLLALVNLIQTLSPALDLIEAPSAACTVALLVPTIIVTIPSLKRGANTTSMCRPSTCSTYLRPSDAGDVSQTWTTTRTCTATWHCIEMCSWIWAARTAALSSCPTTKLLTMCKIAILTTSGLNVSVATPCLILLNLLCGI